MHFRDIAKAIKKKLLLRMTYTIFFNHLCRTRNITGLLLEQQRRKKEKEQFIILVRGSSIKYEKGFLIMFEPTNFHCKVTDIQAKAFIFGSYMVPLSYSFMLMKEIIYLQRKY